MVGSGRGQDHGGIGAESWWDRGGARAPSTTLASNGVFAGLSKHVGVGPEQRQTLHAFCSFTKSPEPSTVNTPLPVCLGGVKGQLTDTPGVKGPVLRSEGENTRV